MIKFNIFNLKLKTSLQLNKLKACFSSVATILNEKKPGDVITVKGWIKSLRNQKEHIFCDVSDGSTDRKLQLCLPKTSTERLSPGTSVIASGPLSLSPKGQLELSVQNIEICGPCVITDGYPFAPRKQYTQEYIRQYLHFRPRTNKFSALLRIRNAATVAIYNYFQNEGFINVHTPILTSNDCEGAGEVFKVLPESNSLMKTMLKEGQNQDEAYFNRKTFLTVSGQLHLEAAAHGLSKVYTFGPTFRAENSKSRFHLSEFYMIEAEIAFVDNVQVLTRFVEDLLKKVTGKLFGQMGEDFDRCQGSEECPWLNKEFPTITYKQAVDILNNKTDNFKESFNPNEGFSKEHELFLVKQFDNIPVFVINWPKEMKPFYMKENPDGTVAAFDLLCPTVGELVGGSLRENDYNNLSRKTPKDNNLDWYLELRKFGSVKTGGFGLGFERYLQTILGISNIKDTIPFPRWPHNCSL